MFLCIASIEYPLKAKVFFIVIIPFTGLSTTFEAFNTVHAKGDLSRVALRFGAEQNFL